MPESFTDIVESTLVRFHNLIVSGRNAAQLREIVRELHKVWLTREEAEMLKQVIEERVEGESEGIPK